MIRIKNCFLAVQGFYNTNNDNTGFFYCHRCEISVFLVELFINLIMLLPMKAPMIIDEYLTFSTGAFLSGKYDWSGAYASLPGTPYYGYGQVLFYLPFFWLPISVYGVYKCALVINALLISIIPVLVWYILNKLSLKMANVSKMACALSIGLYSAYLYNSKGVWNETMLSVTPWILVTLLLMLYDTENNKKLQHILSIALGIMCIYYYSLNSRAVIGVIAVLCVLVLTRIFLKRKIVKVISFLSAVVVCYGLNKLIKGYVVNNLLLAGGGGKVDNSSISVSAIFSRLSLTTFLDALEGFFGDIYYVFIVSFGLVGIAIIYSIVLFIQGIVRKKRNALFGKTYIIAMFSTLFMFGNWLMLFLLSYGTFVLQDFTKRDAMMYGRYFDYAIPMGILVAYLSFGDTCRRRKEKTVIGGIALSALVLIFGAVVTGQLLIDKNILSFHRLNAGIVLALGGEQFAGETTFIGVLFLTLVIGVILSVVLALFKYKKYVIAYTLMSAIYVYAAIWVSYDYSWTTSERAYETYVCYSEFFESIESKGVDVNKVYYVSNGYRDRAINIQFALPQYEVEQLNLYLEGYECLDNIEENSIIISSKNFDLDFYIDDIAGVENEDFYMWIYGDDIIDNLNADLLNEKEIALDNMGCTGSTPYKITVGMSGLSLNGPGSFWIRGERLNNVSLDSCQITNFDINEVTYLSEQVIVIEGVATESEGDFELSFRSNANIPTVEVKRIILTDMEGNEAKIEGTDITISCDEVSFANSVMFGPYKSLLKGNYRVIIEGEGLDILSYDYAWNQGKNASAISQFHALSPDKVEFDVSMDCNVDDFEVRAYNYSQSESKVTHIYIQPIEVKHEIGNLYQSVGFTSILLNDLNSIAGTMLLNDVYECGPEYLYLGMDNGMKIENVDLDEGEYQIDVHGKDVKVCVEIVSDTDEVLQTIEWHPKYATSEGAGIRFNIESGLKDTKIIIYALSESPYITDSNKGIVKISEVRIKRL